jgi:uncharacterized protein YoxC
MKQHSFKERTVAGASAVAFSTSIAAMCLESNPSVYVSGVVGAVVAPYATIQQEKITQCEALEQTNERLESEVQQLQHENERLSTQVNQLESSVLHLQEMSSTLDAVRETEGKTLDELEQQLEQSRQIFNSMQDNLMGNILQNLISVVLNCDKDGDMVLSDEEIDTIILKMEGINGIDLNDELLREALVQNGRSLNAILDVARNALDDTVAPEDNIFKFINKEEE